MENTFSSDSWHEYWEDARKMPEKRRASEEDISYLRSTGYPESVIAYFSDSEPVGWYEINGSRMYPVAEIRVENENAIPGYVVAPMGYLNVAANDHGDSYCLDTGSVHGDNEPPVVLISHEEIYEDETTLEDVRRIAGHIADSFEEFLRLFLSGGLPTD